MNFNSDYTEEDYKNDCRLMEFENERQEIAEKKQVKKALSTCKKRVSKVWFDHMLTFIDFDSSEYAYNFRITDKPCCRHKQIEDYRFKHIFLWQSCGIAGDDWSGEISIPIKHGKYLTYNFAC